MRRARFTVGEDGQHWFNVDVHVTKVANLPITGLDANLALRQGRSMFPDTQPDDIHKAFVEASGQDQFQHRPLVTGREPVSMKRVVDWTAGRGAHNAAVAKYGPVERFSGAPIARCAYSRGGQLANLATDWVALSQAKLNALLAKHGDVSAQLSADAVWDAFYAASRVVGTKSYGRGLQEAFEIELERQVETAAAKARAKTTPESASNWRDGHRQA